MKDCDKCYLVSNSDSLRLFENSSWIIELNPHQAYLGRAIVISTAHIGSVREIGQKEWEDFGEISKTFEQRLTQKFRPDNFNWTVLGNTAVSGSELAHLHWHVRPRYSKDIEFANQTFIDPDFGEHYDRTRRGKYDKETLGEIAKFLIK